MEQISNVTESLLHSETYTFVARKELSILCPKNIGTLQKLHKSVKVVQN
jgi:hypothetical protein